jgi:hypothetical protein
MSPNDLSETQRALGWRAKYRLRLAAGLLRAEGHRFEIPRDQFYEHIALVLERLPEPDRNRLKGLVDWIEAFDPKDDLSADAGRRPEAKATPGRRSTISQSSTPTVSG